MKTTLVIMAAGIGSRFGGGIKQLAPIGRNGEIVIDYSIHDAIEAGFNKIVFIIRHDIEDAFREIIGDRIEKVCKGLGVEVDYAFQESHKLPAGFEAFSDRKKPWGTGHAVLCAADKIDTPFAVINADDYYGKIAYRRVHEYLLGYTSEKPDDLCMAGFILKNTLSENGTVTRGICMGDANGYLTQITETSDIARAGDKVMAGDKELSPECLCSMNMWGLTPEFLGKLKSGFDTFLKNIGEDYSKKEYLLPIYIGELLTRDEVTVKILETTDKWIGMTYKEDLDSVIAAIGELTDKGVYGEDLFADLK